MVLGQEWINSGNLRQSPTVPGTLGTIKSSSTQRLYLAAKYYSGGVQQSHKH
ncbi:hypothetical protein Save01_08328 [Streptomyces avermitilis]